MESYDADTTATMVSMKDGTDLKILFFKDQMMGTTGKPLDVLWGLKKYFSMAHFRAAKATTALMKDLQ